MRGNKIITRLIVYLLVIALAFCVYSIIDAGKQLKSTFESLIDENTALKIKIVHLESDIADQNGQIDKLLSELKSNQTSPSKTDRSGVTQGKKRTMEVTAYDLSIESCGKSPSHPEYGITASGNKVREWHTIAAGPELPFGTKVYIPCFSDKPNGGIFTVQDRGGAIKNGRLDVYMANNSDCLEFGRQQLEVWILE